MNFKEMIKERKIKRRRIRRLRKLLLSIDEYKLGISEHKKKIDICSGDIKFHNELIEIENRIIKDEELEIDKLIGLLREAR